MSMQWIVNESPRSGDTSIWPEAYDDAGRTPIVGASIALPYGDGTKVRAIVIAVDAEHITLTVRLAPMVVSDPVPFVAGSPRVCPACGGASVFAERMVMEGRACRYAMKGGVLLAFYCGDYERRNEGFDVAFAGDMDLFQVSGYNTQLIGAVMGACNEAQRVSHGVRAALADIGVDLGQATALIAERVAAVRAVPMIEAPKKRKAKRKGARAAA